MKRFPMQRGAGGYQEFCAKRRICYTVSSCLSHSARAQLFKGPINLHDALNFGLNVAWINRHVNTGQRWLNTAPWQFTLFNLPEGLNLSVIAATVLGGSSQTLHQNRRQYRWERSRGLLSAGKTRVFGVSSFAFRDCTPERIVKWINR